MIPQNNLLAVHNLSLSFVKNKQNLRALSQVSFSLSPGETVGIVGESGCGKSLTAYSIMNMLPPKAEASGEIYFTKKNGDCVEVLGQTPSSAYMREIRTKEIGMIYQEPMSALNPVYTINQQISEAILTHNNINKKEAEQRVVELLSYVGIPEPEKRAHQYPHQFSGGMCQRALIAMALCCNPYLLIADEPTTALDVTIEAQILSLMKSVQIENNMAMLLISHDLGVIGQMSDRIIVMYAGSIVESANAASIIKDPHHPYTEGLIKARPTYSCSRLYEIPGVVPALDNRGIGCLFAGRCTHATDVCFQEEPPLVYIGEDREVRCWLYE